MVNSGPLLLYGKRRDGDSEMIVMKGGREVFSCSATCLRTLRLRVCDQHQSRATQVQQNKGVTDESVATTVSGLREMHSFNLKLPQTFCIVNNFTIDLLMLCVRLAIILNMLNQLSCCLCMLLSGRTCKTTFVHQ
jgi:hypothetical protein